MVAKGIKNKVFQNWAKTYKCQPLLYFEPNNIDEVKEIVELAKSNNKKVKVAGNGHSPSSIACTDDYMISLKNMNNVLNIDKDKLQIKVEAGMMMTKLNKILEDNDMSLSSLPSISDQQIGGAISTASHGTGINFPTLSSFAVETEMLLASGKIEKYSRTSNSDVFPAVACSLGSLGIILTITIQCEKLFKLKSVEYGSTLNEALQSLDAQANSSEHFRILWIPHTENVICSHWNRSDQPISNKQNWFINYIVKFQLLQFLYWLSSFVQALVPIIHRLYSKIFSQYSEKVDISYNVFNFDCLFSQFVYEAAFPIEKTAYVLHQMKAWLQENNHVKVHFFIEIRFTKSDDIWLSPCYNQDTCYINIIMYRPYGKTIPYKEWFDYFENLMIECNGRPHWAKAHKLKRDKLEQIYPKFKEFNELRKKLDPTGLFMNEYLLNIFA